MTADRGNGRWAETTLLVALTAALMSTITLPAFRAYFFGEAFLYLGQYWGAQQRFWRALASPSDVVFFKPVSFATSIPWYGLLPPDPWWYHVRNLGFTIANLVLLHRVLLRLVDDTRARGVALALFAVSKVHLTTIGYLMILDSIVMLGLLLGSVLFVLRWRATRAARDHWSALACCALCAFSKDYGVAAIVVVLAFVAQDALERRRPIGSSVAWRWLAPLASIAVARVVLRYLVAGPMPWWHPVYAPHVSVAEIGRKALVFASALSNLSVGWHDKTGAPGFGSLLVGREPPRIAGAIDVAEAIDAIAGIALMLVAALSLRRARIDWRRLVGPVAWMAAFFVPPLLTRNVQIYYAYEPLAAAAVLLGIVLAATDAATLRVWTVLVAAIAVAGLASNRAALYDWQFAADSAAKLRAAVIEPYRGSSSLRSLTFVTRDVPFWRWVLTADDKAPMLEFLLERPGLPVRVLDRGVLVDAPRLDPTHLVLDADADFARVAPVRP
jgi:hypothetical protein